MNASTIAGALVALLAIGGLFMVAASAEPTSHEDGEHIVLTHDETSNFEFNVSTDSTYSINVLNANGTQLASYDATTEASGDGYLVSADIVNNDLINHSDAPVEAGDELTIEVYDDTNSEATENTTVTVAHIADGAVTFTSTDVSNLDEIEILSQDSWFGFGSSYDVSEIEHEFTDVNTSSNQTLAMDLEDSDLKSTFDAAAEDADAGDQIDAQMTVNGDKVPVFAEEVPEDHDGDVAAYYDSDAGTPVITGDFDQSSVLVEATGNEDYGVFEAFSFDWDFDVLSFDLPSLDGFLGNSTDA